MVESSAFSTLPDGANDRFVSEKDCPSLVNKPLEDSKLFGGPGGIPDWRLLKEMLSREGPITKPQCCKLLR